MDVDVFLGHMGSARYMREVDFARASFYDLTGMWEKIFNRKYNPLIGASSIWYRRHIPIFARYKVITQVSLDDISRIGLYLFPSGNATPLHTLLNG